MKILKSIILDKLKEKSSVGASIFESIGKSKWKNDILNDKSPKNYLNFKFLTIFNILNYITF